MSDGNDQLDQHNNTDQQNDVPNSRKIWNAEEDQELRQEFAAGWKLTDIASKHGRSVAGVRKRSERLGLNKPE